jgi:hypothetical protein
MDASPGWERIAKKLRVYAGNRVVVFGAPADVFAPIVSSMDLVRDIRVL